MAQVPSTDAHSPLSGLLAPAAVFGVIAVAYVPLWLAIAGISHEESYSFLPVIPFISAFFAFRNRQKSPSGKRRIAWSGLGAVGAAIILYIAGSVPPCINYPILPATLLALSCIAAVVGGCALVWGWGTVRHHLFPILFLLLAVPLPPIVLGAITTYLQYGSAEVVNLIFKISGMTYVRDGLTFHFPAMTIYIAEQCSGIRSTLALVIITIVAGQISLHSPWRKLILALWILPVSLVKNGIRIATLSFLANYVDTKYITDSFLHHQGGFVFYAIALAIIFGMLAVLRLTEKRNIVPDESGTQRA